MAKGPILLTLTAMTNEPALVELGEIARVINELTELANMQHSASASPLVLQGAQHLEKLIEAVTHKPLFDVSQAVRIQS